MALVSKGQHKFSEAVICIVFHNMPENISNLLGRQIRSFNRPVISFTSTEMAHRRNTFKDKGKLNLEQITLSFFDDENGLVSALLYSQVFRQINKHTDVFGKGMGRDDLNREYKFGIEVQYFTSTGEEAEAFLLTGCFISNMSHTDSDMTDSSETEILVTIEYDNLAIKAFEDFVEVFRS